MNVSENNAEQPTPPETPEAEKFPTMMLVNICITMAVLYFFYQYYQVLVPAQKETQPSAAGAFSPLQAIKNKVALDSIAQYEIASRQGDAMQICVQAGFVAAAFLQAQNEAEYRRWKATEDSKCATAMAQ